MNQESASFGVGIVGIVIGLAVLLSGEYVHVRSVVYGGGVIMLAAVSVMAIAVARL